jgi:hypothetical protein
LAVRSSRKVLEAALPAGGWVRFPGALCRLSALPANDLDALPVSGLFNVSETLLAAGFEVVSFLRHVDPPAWKRQQTLSRQILCPQCEGIN